MTKKAENMIPRRAENAAALWLQLEGYRILERRV